MNPSGDRHEELARREQELKDRELQIRLREMEAELKDRDTPIYQTEKHQPQKVQKPWLKKAIFAGKLFAIGVAAIVAFKVASVLSTVVLVGLIGWFGYKILWESKRQKR